VNPPIAAVRPGCRVAAGQRVGGSTSGKMRVSARVGEVGPPVAILGSDGAPPDTVELEPAHCAASRRARAAQAMAAEEPALPPPVTPLTRSAARSNQAAPTQNQQIWASGRWPADARWAAPSRRQARRSSPGPGCRGRSAVRAAARYPGAISVRWDDCAGLVRASAERETQPRDLLPPVARPPKARRLQVSLHDNGLQADRSQRPEALHGGVHQHSAKPPALV
jgi:hypothetical protein